MQPHERGGAKSEEVLSLTPSSKKPASLYFSGRRALLIASDGCQCDPGPSRIKQRRAGLGCPGFHGLNCVQLCSAISQEAKGGSPWLSVSREEAVDFIFSIEECLQLHTQSPPISQNKLLAKDAMLLRYCFCMTISQANQANHSTCPACVSMPNTFCLCRQ